jgi:4-hydroxybenzoate polyprenyltransferase
MTLLSYASYVAHYAFYESAYRGALGFDAVGAGAAVSAVGLVYMADRMVVQEEDRDATHDHIKHARSAAAGGFLAAFGALWVACALLRPLVAAHTAAAAAVCVWYAVPIPGVGRRIKNLFPLSKNVFVGLVHAYWVAACSGAWPATAERAAFFGFAAFSVTQSTVFMDVKDVDGDARAGVVTLPTLLGAAPALRCLAHAYGAAAAISTAAALVAAAAPTPFACLAVTYATLRGAMLRMAARGETPALGFVAFSWSLPLGLWLAATLAGA